MVAYGHIRQRVIYEHSPGIAFFLIGSTLFQKDLQFNVKISTWRNFVKTSLPRGAYQNLSNLLTFFREGADILQRITYPVKKHFYHIVIKVLPGANWAYDRILGLINQQRNYDVLFYSKLFLGYFKRYSEVNPACILKWRVEASIAYLMLHDTESLQAAMQSYFKLQDKHINQGLLDTLGSRIIKEDVFHFYNTHAYLDTHVKAMLLGWAPEYRLIQCIDSPKSVLNPVMLDYWKQYITVIDDPKLINKISKIRKKLEIDVCLATPIKGEAVYIEHAKGIVQKEWERQKRDPLFQLNPEDIAYGKEKLLAMGIPENAWFVSLHVRDAGYKTGSYEGKEEYDSYRNADIDSYKLAIQEIVQRGGYVVRVGDPHMKPFEEMDGCFDYARSDLRSNRMDIFLFSQCRFFVGVSSGPVLSPTLFGVPVVMTNFIPMSGRPHAGNCLFISKLLWNKVEKKHVTCEEVLATDLGRVFTSHGYEEKEIEIIDNSPEDLRDVVIEMLNRFEGGNGYFGEDERRQQKVTRLYQKYSGYGDMGRIGNAFAKKLAHMELI